MANPVVHFESIGKDGPALREFYKSGFDWQMNPIGAPLDYALVEAGNTRGGIGQCPQGHLIGLVQNA